MFLILSGLLQGLMQHHEEIVDYFNSKGVSAIFLFRRNLLRRMISILGNSYDQKNKPLNGTHKSHVHSTHEVPSLSLSLKSANVLQSYSIQILLVQAEILARYKPTIDTKQLIPNLEQVEDLVTKSMQYLNSTRHIILYYEDIRNNRTVRLTAENLHYITYISNACFICVPFFQKLVDVQEFLKVPQRDLSSRQVKIHKGALSSQIENWEEVERTLKGTRYERFLDDDYKVNM